MMTVCRRYCSVPGPLQTGQRAEFLGVILGLQAADGIHVGVDNLSVVRHVGRLLDGNVCSRPAELVKDGDLILLIGRMLRLRGLDTVRITKVKGHVDECMVRDGGVRELDRLGNDAADEAADFGRRTVDFPVIDARRNFAGVCGRWYPVVLVLHRFFLTRSPGLWLTMWVVMEVRLIRWSGLLVLFQKGAGWFMLCAIMFFCMVQRAFGMVNGSLLLLHLSLMMTLGLGHTPLGSWLSGLLSWGRCTGQRLVLIWGRNFCMSYGLVRDWSLRRPFPGIADLDAQFQCRLFRLVQALIFGVRAGGLFFGN